MRLTVLGSSASYPGPGRACAGHFLEGGGARILMDCGNGVLANLAQVEDPIGLDAVFITHNHPDHYADLYALHAAIRFAPDGPRAPMPLYLPHGLWERLPLLLSERGAADMAEAFVPIELASHVPVTLGGLTITPIAVVHTEPTFALLAEADGVRVAYSADTAPQGGVFEVARDVDLILAEATLPEEYANAAPHMTAAQAAQLARDSGARALALVHIWPTNDRDEMASVASKIFGAVVVAAEEFDVFNITPDGGRDD